MSHCLDHPDAKLEAALTDLRSRLESVEADTKRAIESAYREGWADLRSGMSEIGDNGRGVWYSDEFIARMQAELRDLRSRLESAERENQKLTTAINKSCVIIERADTRLLASDGDCGRLPPEMTLDEWRELYVALDEARAQSPSTNQGETNG